MNTSLFELFKIGIGPSSSHTVGPMRAALRFVNELPPGLDVQRVKTELFGSLALTGIGHGTDRAILLGLSGEAPDRLDPASIEAKLQRIRRLGVLSLGGVRDIAFAEATDLVFERNQMYPPGSTHATSHPNGMRFLAMDEDGKTLTEQIYYSVGGGFILSAAELAPDPQEKAVTPRAVPYPFASAAQLLTLAQANDLTLAELVLANECALFDGERTGGKAIARPGVAGGTTREQIESSVLALWTAMQQCTERGMVTEGILPGGLNVRRRAPRLHQRIRGLDDASTASGKPRDPLAPLDWVSLFAIAVNEENAAGGAWLRPQPTVPRG